MDLGWTQALAIIGANILMFLGLLGTTITLFLHSNKRIDTALEGMAKEMKDFHGRLCDIEARRTK